MALPALRNVDISPIRHEGQSFVCLRDAEGFVEQQLVLSPEAFFVAAYLDGSNDVTDIQYHFVNQYGAVISPEDIQKVVAHLDDQGFLVTERFEGVRKMVLDAFNEAPARPLYLAGKTYPDNPDELRSFLDDFFLKDPGPGEKPGTDPGTGVPPKALIVPHIDFDRGGSTYAHGYLRLFKQGRPHTAFIFGVVHGLGPAPFILTKKDFDTPFGRLTTDRETVDQLASACAWDPFEHEIVHRTEHSIEFQAVALAYLYGPEIRIVPILCGAFAEDPDAVPALPSSFPGVTAFLDKCRELLAASDHGVTVIAGADLAHVGRRFGDPFDIDDAVVSAVEARDREDLAYVSALDADGFYRSVLKDGNERKVCGLNAIYATLKVVQADGRSAELLHYAHAPDPAGGMVSFASLLVP